MDTGPSNNASHMQHGAENNNYTVDFLGGIQNFAHSADQDDLQQYFHSDLFDSGQDFNHGSQAQPQARHQMQQSQLPQQTSYSNPPMSQHSNGQAQNHSLSAFNQSTQYAQHSQYPPQHIYDQRNMYSQQAYDPRLFQQRSSQSPGTLEPYNYVNQFGGQTHHNQLNIAPRPSPSPAPQYPPRQQTYSPFATFDSRGPTLPQHQDAELMHFNSFHAHPQQSSHPFVNPSLLNSDNVNGQYPQAAQQQPQQGVYYPKPGTATGQHFPPQAPVQQNSLQPVPQQHLQGSFPQLAPGSLATTELTQASTSAKNVSRKDGPAPSVEGGSVGSTSESDLEIEDEGPEPAPALISVAPPTDPRARAIFNAVQSVWSPRNKVAPTEKIKAGVIQYGDIIRGLRDQWKIRNDNLKKAEADQSPTATEAPRLRTETAQYRQTTENLVNKTVLFAHPAILKSLGENVFTLSALYAFMLDRVSALDYESSLLLAILKLAEKFRTLDEEKLESAKWIKLLQRVSKKGVGEAKQLAQHILDHAKKMSTRKAENAKSEGKGDLAAGVKRPREGDFTGPAPKKVVKPSSKPLALQAAEKRRLEATEAAKKSKATAPAVSGTLITPAAAKPKPPLKASTTTSFSSLMSASKKPGTTNAERAAASKSGAATTVQLVKKEPLKRDSPPATAASLAAAKGASFLNNLFSGIDKKEEVKPKEEIEDTKEMPEEKAKRLRKESRRKLRVSWKNDNDLVETRYFTHDPDEETNQGDSAKKDVGDTGKEGEMLKRHQNLDDLDEEDEEDDADFDPDCYSPPSSIDFSELASEDCDPAANGMKHGGQMIAESKAKEDQDKFEETVLMVFYSTSERPDSPKEPPEEAEDDFSPSDEFGEPDEKVRVREREIYARRRPPTIGMDGMSDFASSLKNLSSNATQSFGAQAAQQSTSDILKQLAAMGVLQQQQTTQPTAPPPTAAPTSGFDLASFVSNFQNSQSGSQPVYQPPTQAAPVDLSAILSRMASPSNPPVASIYTPPTHEDYGNSNSNGKKGNNKKGKKSVPLDENGLPLNYKTKVCEFWQKGMCTKGDHCTYRHSK